jgi:mannose-6-phosphate isomerase
VGLLPKGETGKTEAWVVLSADPKSRIYAGLKPGATAENLREALASGTVPDHIASFTPKPGDAVFLPAGTVHTLGGGVVVFEIQQNSDVTFRLFDWGHVDSQTGQPRPLQVQQALDSIDFAERPSGPVVPVVEATVPAKRERLFQCQYFELWRVSGRCPFAAGAADVARVLVCIEGTGQIVYHGATYPAAKGDVWLLPAVVGACAFQPRGRVSLLEIALPGAGK